MEQYRNFLHVLACITLGYLLNLTFDGVPFTSNAQSGLYSFNSVNTPVSLNTSNDWYITITAKGQTISETVGILGASVTPMK